MYGVLKIYYVVLIYLIFGKSFFHVPDLILDVLILGFIVLSTYFDRYKLKISRKLGNYCIWTALLPAIIILFYSIALQFLQSLSFDYIVRSIMLCLRWILYCLWAIRTIYIFNKKSADLLLASCTVAYIPSIIIFFAQFGVIGGINTLLSKNIYHDFVALEVHRLTYVFGFLAVYYLYQWIILRKRVILQFLLSTLFLFLGLKRIANMAFIIAVLVVLILKFIRKEKNKYRFACILSVCLVLLSLGYIYLIKSGILQIVFNYFGIEDSFRFNFWNHISPYYDFSVGFTGRGISFAQRFMWHEWSNIKDLSVGTNIHNDILSYYIGLGFIGFCAFFLLVFTGQTILLKKWFSVHCAAIAIEISLFYFIIMATSNEGLPGFVFACYIMLILASTTETSNNITS